MASNNTEQSIDKLFELIEDIEIAMMTTRCDDGHLRARAMATQKRTAGADLWFVSASNTGKIEEIERDPHVNLSYFDGKRMQWVSISGVAFVSSDRAKIRELYAPDWKAWFGEEGDPRHGTPDDPRIVLIGVNVHKAEFLEVNKPRAVIIYELVKGMVTGEKPELGEMRTVHGRS